MVGTGDLMIEMWRRWRMETFAELERDRVVRVAFLIGGRRREPVSEEATVKECCLFEVHVGT